MNVKFGPIRGIEEINAFIKTLPRGTVKVGLKALVDYMIGTPQHGLKHNQPYKHVTRKRAYGRPFESDRQRRYVMARIREGSIDPGVPHRTGNTQRSYRSKETRGGYGQTIEAGAGAYWTRDDTGQARLNALAGWQKFSVVIENNMAGALRAARAAVNAWLKRR